jgi:hypothetical protein
MISKLLTCTLLLVGYGYALQALDSQSFNLT